MAKLAGTVMEQVPSLLPTGRIEDRVGHPVGRLRSRLAHREPVAVAGMKDIAHRLLATTQLLSDFTGMAAPLTGQQDLATAHGKARTAARRTGPAAPHRSRGEG